MFDEATPVENEVKEEVKTEDTSAKKSSKGSKGKTTAKAKSATKGKKSVSKQTKKAPKKTAKERKELEKKASSPKPKKEGGRSRTVEVNGEKWPRRKATILRCLQKLKKEVSKVELLAEMDKYNEKETNTNVFCHELAQEGLIDMNSYQGDPGWYRQITPKGAKVKLPIV